MALVFALPTELSQISLFHSAPLVVKSAVMNVDLGIWGKLTRVVVLLLFLAGLLGVAVWYLPLIKQNEQWRKEILRKDAQIQLEEENARQLRASIEALHRDPKAIERLARERLGYAKPGETVFRFEPPVTNNVVAR